jgi:adenylate cyclase
MTEEKAPPTARPGTTLLAATTLSGWPLPANLPPSDALGLMPLEIERKFLVATDAWKRDILKSEYMRDGLIARFGDGKVRVRLTERSAWLTIKGPRKGISRLEFEYEIPRSHAEEMLQTLCQRDPILEKVRHTVPFGGLNWTIDLYTGPLSGVVLAEVELEHPNQQLQLPPWIGEEVTNNPRYRKRALVPVLHRMVEDPRAEGSVRC